MNELQIGDIVMSHDEGIVVYSPVIMFLHHLEEEQGEFFKITAVSYPLFLIFELSTGRQDIGTDIRASDLRVQLPPRRELPPRPG